MKISMDLPDDVLLEGISPPHFVQEDAEEYVRHDQLFKELIETFFEEFVEVFFPNLYKDISFDKLIFLSEEILPDMYDGQKQVLDTVAQVRWKSADLLMIIHVEPQSYKQDDFHERMFIYFSSLYKRFRMPILPIAIFSYDEAWDKDTFEMIVLNKSILYFNYFTIHLRKQNWRDFININNPVSAALLSKMGFTVDERIKVKVEFLRILTNLQLDREKTTLLISFFERYLQLTDEEEAIAMEEVKKFRGPVPISEHIVSYERRGIEKGIEQGIEQGRKELVLELLDAGRIDEVEALEMLAITKEQLDELRRKH